jgi:hypothetical protein
VLVLVLDLLLLRLLDGDRGVGSKVMLIELKSVLNGLFGYSDIHI